MEDFKNGKWNENVDVIDFITQNITPYLGDESFLKPATQRTLSILEKVRELVKKEHEKGILNLDTKTPSSITAFPPGYIEKPTTTVFLAYIQKN